EAIIVEITETAMSLDERRVESAMTTFHKGGMAIYLDDFGTGYSSLSRLKHMPINTLKIDKTFVDGVPEDKDNLSIVDATLKLAASLEIDALAEGIETEVQYHWFLSRNCRYAQGFYFSPPLPEDQLVALYRSRKDWR
ncbi:MAG: EAL domain-containing protein, partial [Hydrogenovibrio sp.]|nr:EAL domain-containing protein [Hydrogenovibrio sp.]